MGFSNQIAGGGAKIVGKVLNVDVFAKENNELVTNMKENELWYVL